ncbi:MAG: fatty acid desaturase [Spirochaetota bacterium]
MPSTRSSYPTGATHGEASGSATSGTRRATPSGATRTRRTPISSALTSLPHWYGGRWYHRLVHDTMHVGRTPESNDFRESCRSVRVDPFTSFMYWHMEWHTEHHTFAAVPCYNLRKFHNLTAEHWEEPQTLWQAWREMTESSRELLAIPATEAAHE